MAKLEALTNQLAEIADYFAGCAENAAKGSNAEVHFMVLKNAAKIAREKLMDGDTVRVTRCAECRFWEPENAEEGDSYGRCRNDYAPCQNQQTDMNWFCADGKREG
jgi:hypothetical protein